MSAQPSIDLERLEALCNDAPAQMTDEVLDMDIREWRVFLVEGAQSFYDAARAALPTLIVECRQLRAQVAGANEVIAMQSALIRTLERGHAMDRAMIDQLGDALIGSQVDAYKAAHPGLEDIAYTRAYDEYRTAADALHPKESQ